MFAGDSTRREELAGEQLAPMYPGAGKNRVTKTLTLKWLSQSAPSRR